LGFGVTVGAGECVGEAVETIVGVGDAAPGDGDAPGASARAPQAAATSGSTTRSRIGNDERLDALGTAVHDETVTNIS
jgi:hypothetical protein